MSRKNQQVIPLGNGWAVKAEGADKFGKIREVTNYRTVVAIPKNYPRSSSFSLFRILLLGRKYFERFTINGNRECSVLKTDTFCSVEDVYQFLIGQ